MWWMASALASGEGRHPAALRLASAAEAAVQGGGLPVHEVVQSQPRPWPEAARSTFRRSRARQLADEGAELTFDQLVREALGGPAEVDADPLSPREHEIAGLIAAGLTNGEIAECLAISLRTVESHVDHMRGELGFARRERIIAWALDADQAARRRS